MKTLSTDEYIKKYGMDNYINLLKMSPQNVQPKSSGGIGQQIGEAFKSGVSQVKEGLNQGANAQNPVQLFEGSLKTGAGIVNTAFSPLAPVFKPVEKAVTAVGNKISDIPAVQKFASSKAGEITSRVTEDVANLDTIAAAVAGSKTAMKTGEVLPGAIRSGATKAGELTSKVAQPFKAATGEITPGLENIVNHQISLALDLTQGDLRNINSATGHEVGQFIAEKNLIGTNKATTVDNLQTFFKQNYDTVRTEIGKVDKVYKQDALPRYTEALVELKKQAKEVAGLQESNAKIDTLLKKKKLVLSDVQQVKELMDDQLSLYKATGDVKEGIAKKGLANIRKDLQVFIENEVKKNTGTDIRELNNNVSTSKSILEAVENRSTRGLSRTHLTLRDLSLFTGGSITGTPLFGAALVIAKKIYESPAIRLKISKFLDELTDKRKAAIQAKLEAGKVPPELNKIINGKGGGIGNTLKDDVEPLANEAKKYKSAEEFVNAQPKLYHSGTADIKEVNLNKTNFNKTFYLSDNADYAKSFGGKESTINEIVVNPEAKLVDMRKPSADLVSQIEAKVREKIAKNVPYGDKNFSFYPFSTQDVIQGIKDGKAHFAELPGIKKILQELGYDGQITNEVPYAKNIGIWNKNVVKTKSQLIDIWKKAKTKKP